MIDIQTQSLTETLKKQIYDGFTRHAIQATGFDETSAPVAFIDMEENVFVGAIVVAHFWGALHTKYLYVEETFRGRGIGSRLMQKAFTYGKEKNVSFAFVETMSFQALPFYEKMGFALEFTRSGYAHGASFHYLAKKLT
jgi:ribosomal protein S18 acetylase RimI-like enzyme